jgi:hypothetical protein
MIATQERRMKAADGTVFVIVETDRERERDPYLIDSFICYTIVLFFKK